MIFFSNIFILFALRYNRFTEFQFINKFNNILPIIYILLLINILFLVGKGICID